jgi:putative transcriptional regulator
MQLPYFLVALPSLNDPLFTHSVVLMTEHTDEGAMGFVINHPMVQDNETLTQMVAEVRDATGEKVLEYEELLFNGGPTQNDAIFALHNIEDVADQDTRVSSELFLTNNADTFHRLLESDEYKMRRRFFVGCASWGPGQLDAELRSGAWFSVAYDKKFVFRTLSTEEIDEKWKDRCWTEVSKVGGVDPLTTMSPGSNGGEVN